MAERQKLTPEPKLVHLELQSQLGDIVDKQGEGGHQAQSWQVHEGQCSCGLSDLVL